MARILLTGSAGAVARSIVPELTAHGHQVRGFDRVAAAGLAESVVEDIENFHAVRQAMQNIDAIIHLAAIPDDTEFPQLMGPNVLGLFNVLRAARELGVGRVILASSIQVVSKASRVQRKASVHEASPCNHYALTKLWAEEMGEMYSRCYGMSVLAVRIGWLVRNRKEAFAMMSRPRPELYLSAHDAGRFFRCAVEAKAVSFAVLYALSAEAADAFDLEPSRQLLGYIPQDRWPSGLGFELPSEIA
jgi:uronate dehydrogenase